MIEQIKPSATDLAKTSTGKPVSANGSTTSNTSAALSAIAARGSERMPGVILTVESGLFEDGRQFARSSGTTVPREDDLKVLREHADAVAGSAIRPLFDPAQHAHDKELDSEHQKSLRDREDEELGLKRSQVELAERKDAAARARAKVPPIPSEPALLLKSAAVLALAATIAPAAHDFLWTMEDEFLAWLFSVITGLVFGLLITMLILGDNHQSEHRSVTNWFGLIAGLGVGLAFFLLRIKGAEGGEQILFGLATSVLEIAIVLFLEGLAMSRRAALRNHLPKEAEAAEAEALVQTQETEVDRRKENVARINANIEGHGRYLEERHVRATYPDQIRDTARRAVENGYAKGVAENRGIVTGVK